MFPLYLLALVLAITLHEAGHGFAAKLLGDRTAERHGRLSLNPIVHIDLVGTILFPLIGLLSGSPFLFGWAKPVPVDFQKLKPARLGMALVSFAGPGVNLLLALISALLLHAVIYPHSLTHEFLVHSIQINLVLAAFNLFPLLPLDGGRILAAALPGKLQKMWAKLEPYGFFILLGFIILPSILKNAGFRVDPLRDYFLFPVLKFFQFVILTLSGNL